MPQYHPKENWRKRGKVIITPRPWLRSFPILKELLPYHVGDRVRFHLHIEKPIQDNPSIFSHFVFEKFGNGALRQLPYNIDGTDAEIEGNIIDSEGDVKYGIGLASHYQEEPDTIFTTKVDNWDTVLSRWSWAIVGAILSYALGIASGFIEVKPFWRIWWPW